MKGSFLFREKSFEDAMCAFIKFKLINLFFINMIILFFTHVITSFNLWILPDFTIQSITFP